MRSNPLDDLIITEPLEREDDCEDREVVIALRELSEHGPDEEIGFP